MWEFQERIYFDENEGSDYDMEEYYSAEEEHLQFLENEGDFLEEKEFLDDYGNRR